jgi:hypothetical protein
MRQDHAYLPQNVRQKNVDDMRRNSNSKVCYALDPYAPRL